MADRLPLSEFIRRFEDLSGPGDPLPDHLWERIQTLAIRDAEEADARDADARLSVQQEQERLAHVLTASSKARYLAGITDAFEPPAG